VKFTMHGDVPFMKEICWNEIRLATLRNHFA